MVSHSSLLLYRMLLVDEINRITPWAQIQPSEEHDNSRIPAAQKRLRELEDILAEVDEELGPSLKETR